MRFFYLLRIHHWVKNLFVFIPAFFAGQLLDIHVLVLLSEGFLCFCLMASAIYILNDYRDIEADKLHPVKRQRPLASGKVSPGLALGIMAVLFIVSLGWSYTLSEVPTFAILVAVYGAVNIGYSLGLKNISLVDIFMVSSGFLIRAVAGGVLIGVAISQWLIIMVFLLSIFLAFAKRRDDLVLAQTSGTALRASVRQYNIEFINTCLALISGVIMVSYIMYTISEEVVLRIGRDYLYITALFVFAGLLRYMQITLVKNDSGSPTKILLTDRFIQCTILGFIITFLLIIYV
ncbi:MAG TPA: decaprenyl-phosphate phosphoribosyltransferase [Ohtaekwangia sp.]|uniref:decaprenyl-phosphate phosphoribosyltransferase n=1 Tax=Ohtaekwangia sp. TaxID=2066019 RepID=UPI002F91CC3E